MTFCTRFSFTYNLISIFFYFSYWYWFRRLPLLSVVSWLRFHWSTIFRMSVSDDNLRKQKNKQIHYFNFTNINCDMNNASVLLIWPCDYFLSNWIKNKRIINVSTQIRNTIDIIIKFSLSPTFTRILFQSCFRLNEQYQKNWRMNKRKKKEQ